jgi:hypothetical protein
MGLFLEKRESPLPFRGSESARGCRGAVVLPPQSPPARAAAWIPGSAPRPAPG